MLTSALTLSPGRSARAADALYEIKKTEPKVAVGATATASLTITPRPAGTSTREAPITVALTPPAGVTVQKAKLTRADLAQSTQESARFDIPVSATEAGKKTINAEARFVLCQEQACKPVKETLALALDVTPAARRRAGAQGARRSQAQVAAAPRAATRSRSLEVADDLLDLARERRAERADRRHRQPLGRSTRRATSRMSVGPDARQRPGALLLRLGPRVELGPAEPAAQPVEIVVRGLEVADEAPLGLVELVLADELLAEAAQHRQRLA